MIFGLSNSINNAQNQYISHEISFVSSCSFENKEFSIVPFDKCEKQFFQNRNNVLKILSPFGLIAYNGFFEFFKENFSYNKPTTFAYLSDYLDFSIQTRAP